MPVDKQKQYERQHDWNKRNTTGVYLQFMKNTEADLLAHLQAQPNKSGYIKSLIRADMEKHKHE